MFVTFPIVCHEFSTIQFVIVALRFGDDSVDCTFQVADIIGDPGKTCHTFNYGIHIAEDYAEGLQTADIFAALHPAY